MRNVNITVWVMALLLWLGIAVAQGSDGVSFSGMAPYTGYTVGGIAGASSIAANWWHNYNGSGCATHTNEGGTTWSQYYGSDGSLGCTTDASGACSVSATGSHNPDFALDARSVTGTYGSGSIHVTASCAGFSCGSGPNATFVIVGDQATRTPTPTRNANTYANTYAVSMSG